jgi:tetratricopeptide (TPR) repeat protein
MMSKQPADNCSPSNRVRFDSWKQIAGYLRTSVRTVQRWEKTEGLPVHRHEHARQDTVYAYKSEVDRWREGRDRQTPASQTGWDAELEAVREALAVQPPSPAAISGRTDRHTVGRALEWEQLHDSLRTVCEGHARLVCLAGEPGIGKTTLLEEVADELNRRGERWRVAFTRCFERFAGTEAYSPVLEMLEALIERDTNTHVGSLLKLVAPTWYTQIAPLWSSTDPAFAAVLERAKTASPERMRRELAAFLGELTKLTPVLLIIDDMHWADASTAELVAYLCRKPELQRLLIICAYRPAEMSLARHPFLPLKQELAKEHLCRDIPVRLLSRQDVETYLSLKFPTNRFPPALAVSLHQRTEGNPFFLVELIRDLHARCSLVKNEGGWGLAIQTEQIEKSLPDSVQGMIERKMDQLDAGDRRLLAAASVQGVEFDSYVIARGTGFGLADAEERLRRLDRVHGLIRKQHAFDGAENEHSERYTFVHVLYQNAFYGSLTPARRADLSGAIASALIEFHRDNLSRAAAELALLYEAARDFSSAAQYFLEAAKNAARVYANHEAVELSRRAMANASHLPDEVRLPLILKVAFQLAELHLTLSEFDDVVADFSLAEKAATEADLIEQRIEAICGAALALFNLKRTDETRALGQHALELAGREGSETAIASAEMVLAMHSMCVGNLDAAEELSGRAAPVLKASATSPAALHVIEGIAYSAALHGWRLEYEQALPPCEWALERARERGAGFHIVCLLFIRGLGMGNFGRISDALRDLREGMRLSEVNHERYWLPRLPNTLGWLHADVFAFEEALRLNKEGAAIARELRFAEGEANSHVNLASNYLVLGEPERAKEHLDAAEQASRGENWFRWLYQIRLQAQYAQFWIARDDPRRAASYAAASFDLARSTRRRKHIAWAHKLLGDVAVREERHEDAAQEYEAGLQVLRGHPCPSVEWKIALSLARLKACQHQSDASEEYLNLSRDVMRRLAQSISDDGLRATFVKSKPARDLRLRI